MDKQGTHFMIAWLCIWAPPDTQFQTDPLDLGVNRELLQSGAIFVSCHKGDNPILAVEKSCQKCYINQTFILLKLI